ncbi:MAG: single-stranded DNA-binding protein [Sedimentibacter sp.]|uniref:single-stranded DNA-binding protein n=1 Tax=Sedimentibacter sp. TaxID=1960295 RepID=UPI00298135A9|nr:single-stranded DNA-binding protein [Sedimentibacter sp.]MDW5300735.1 single-stranded DNA-binding protein [Sedimentibacter sp.]
MNSCVLLGRIARDPELKFIPSTGMAVTKMTLAVDREMSKEKKQEAAAQGKQTADFINITVFGKSAENCANFLVKGSQCAIHGRINTGNYTTQSGEKRYTTDVIADRVEFIGQKKETVPQDAESYFDEAFDGEDVFHSVGDEDIPF